MKLKKRNEAQTQKIKGLEVELWSEKEKNEELKNFKKIRI